MGMEVIFAVMFWTSVIYWIGQNVVIDGMYAARGQVSPRRKERLTRVARGEAPARYGFTGWVGDMKEDALRAHTNKRRRTARQKARDKAEQAAEARRQQVEEPESKPVDDMVDVVGVRPPGSKPSPRPRPNAPIPDAPKLKTVPVTDDRKTDSPTSPWDEIRDHVRRDAESDAERFPSTNGNGRTYPPKPPRPTPEPDFNATHYRPANVPPPAGDPTQRVMDRIAEQRARNGGTGLTNCEHCGTTVNVGYLHRRKIDSKDKQVCAQCAGLIELNASQVVPVPAGEPLDPNGLYFTVSADGTARSVPVPQDVATTSNEPTLRLVPPPNDHPTVDLDQVRRDMASGIGQCLGCGELKPLVAKHWAVSGEVCADCASKADPKDLRPLDEDTSNGRPTNTNGTDPLATKGTDMFNASGETTRVDATRAFLLELETHIQTNVLPAIEKCAASAGTENVDPEVVAAIAGLRDRFSSAAAGAGDARTKHDDWARLMEEAVNNTSNPANTQYYRHS
jgi:hypothetical protein